MFAQIWHNFKQVDYRYHLVCGLLMRVLIIQYGRYHDETYTVPFTDIDYKVFTDASRHVLNYTSPYNRHTYRYTPIVAILLTPNILLHDYFGKYLFSLVDIMVALLIRAIVKYSFGEYERYRQKYGPKSGPKQLKSGEPKRNRRKGKHKSVETKSDLETTADLSMLVWLYNPMSIAIATRGNCDSLSGLLVLATLYFLQCERKPFWAGVFHGIAVHIRLYPAAYSLAFFMYLSKFSFYSPNYRKGDSKGGIEDVKGNHGAIENNVKTRKRPQGNSKKVNGKIIKVEGKGIALPNNQINTERRTIFRKEYLYYLIPNSDQFKLILGCIIALTILTGTFYLLYGYKFLYESYIYHLIRRDTRHNFSLYFYLQYLTAGIKNIGAWQRALIVLPQLILLLVFSVRYGLNKLTLNFAILSETIVMVSYNTVVTSQYFIWILAVLPLCMWQIKLSKKMALFLVVIWFVSQAAWLLPAYFLEFHGQNMFLYIWVQSVAFFSANMAILGRLVRNFMIIKPERKVI